MRQILHEFARLVWSQTEYWFVRQVLQGACSICELQFQITEYLYWKVICTMTDSTFMKMDWLYDKILKFLPASKKRWLRIKVES